MKVFNKIVTVVLGIMIAALYAKGIITVIDSAYSIMNSGPDYYYDSIFTIVFIMIVFLPFVFMYVYECTHEN